jgi:alkylation response protein AidB-like acyl-CoA dehydrogenase
MVARFARISSAVHDQAQLAAAVSAGALAVAMANAAASDTARKVDGTGIQLHGGIGMTWEHDLQLDFKRAIASEVAFGDATWHRERVACLFNP